jgi:hypothetical protein
MPDSHKSNDKVDNPDQAGDGDAEQASTGVTRLERIRSTSRRPPSPRWLEWELTGALTDATVDLEDGGTLGGMGGRPLVAIGWIIQGETYAVERTFASGPT